MNLLYLTTAVGFLAWGLMGVFGRFPRGKKESYVLRGGRLPMDGERAAWFGAGLLAVALFAALAAREAA